MKEKKEPWEDRHKIVAFLVNKNSANVAVELGVAFGGNSENLLVNTNLKKLYGVDPYKNRWAYNDEMNVKQAELNLTYQKTTERLKKFGQRYKHIRKFSKKALKDILDNLDFIYIDADHSYIGCLNDLRLWMPKVKNGGIIAGDDYHNKIAPGVNTAVNKYFNKLGWKVNTEGHKVWWVKKQSIKKKLSLWDKLFLFNPIIREIHFYTGEFYNATLGKAFFKTRKTRKKTRIFIKKIIKKILPKQFIHLLKNVKK